MFDGIKFDEAIEIKPVLRILKLKSERKGLEKMVQHLQKQSGFYIFYLI